MIQTLFRIIGYLSLFAALVYGAYLLLPVLPFPEEWQVVERLEILLARLRGEAPEPKDQGPEDRAQRIALLEGYDLGHPERMIRLCRWLAEAAGLDKPTIKPLLKAARWHDLGEEGLGDLLAVRRSLSPDERQQLERHPILGEHEVRALTDSEAVALWVRWHHERPDGTGYPDGLMGDEIPLPASILAIADAWEALTHDRPYRAAMDPQEALVALREGAGFQFDPWLVRLFEERVYPRLVA